MQKTICELFAGVGGFRVGMDRLKSGWETVWFSQWEPGRKMQWAHDCYVRHFGDCADLTGEYHTGEDINTVDKSTIPDHTLLVGGFPCQDYSVARTLDASKGIEGEKGVLWWDIREVLIAKKPAFCILENVDRLLNSPAKQRGRDFGIILACFAEQGYSVEWRVVNAAQYGAAQRRRRTFIFAYRNDTAHGLAMAAKSATSIIGETGFMTKAFPITAMKKLHDIQLEGTLADISESFAFKFCNAGYMHDGHIYTAPIAEKEEASIHMGAILQSDVDEKFYISDDRMDRWKYLKGGKQIPRIAKNGYEYIYSEGPVAFPDAWDKPARTILTSEGQVSRCSHVVEDPVSGRLRILTPVEAERLQGFEDDWTIGMPDSMRYFCMGNALVTQMITRMGAVLDTIIANEP